jgi:hypothetical protein
LLLKFLRIGSDEVANREHLEFEERLLDPSRHERWLRHASKLEVKIAGEIGEAHQVIDIAGNVRIAEQQLGNVGVAKSSWFDAP